MEVFEYVFEYFQSTTGAGQNLDGGGLTVRQGAGWSHEHL